MRHLTGQNSCRQPAILIVAVHLGHYAFRNNYDPIDIEAMPASIKLD